MKKNRHKNYRKDFLSLKSIVIILALVFVGLGAFLIKQVFHRPDTLPEMCLEVLPQNKRVGLKIEYRDKQEVVIDLLGQRGVKEGATPEQIEGFVKCIEMAR